MLLHATDTRDAGVQQFPCQAVLFDLDGTIVDSRTCVERKWRSWARLRGLDAADVLARSPGLCNEDTIRLFAPDLDVEAESSALKREEEQCRDGIVEIPGASVLLGSLSPPDWAVVTSAWWRLARIRMAAAGLPEPVVLVTADDVTRGKPDPQGYLQAAERLDVAAEDCVAIEDAPNGIAAARRAGMRVVAVATGSPPDVLDGDVVVQDLRAVGVKGSVQRDHRVRDVRGLQ